MVGRRSVIHWEIRYASFFSLHFSRVLTIPACFALHTARARVFYFLSLFNLYKWKLLSGLVTWIFRIFFRTMGSLSWAVCLLCFLIQVQHYARSVEDLKNQLNAAQDKLHRQSQELSKRDEQMVVLKVELATLQEKHRLIVEEVCNMVRTRLGCIEMWTSRRFNVRFFPRLHRSWLCDSQRGRIGASLIKLPQGVLLYRGRHSNVQG